LKEFLMSDLNSLASIGPAALSQGIGFLYSQAGELLARRRDRREQAKGPASQATDLLAAPVDAADIEGEWSTPASEAAVPEGAEATIRAFLDHLRPYVEGVRPVDQQDATLLEVVDALRQLLEAIYARTMTFVGESRETIRGEVDVDEVLGYAAGIRSALRLDSDVEAKATARRVHPGGELIGLDIPSDGSQ
jgi:hypothetical protein